MKRSIISNERKCFLTGYENVPLDRHHVFNGGLRKWADKEGLWVYLWHERHMEAHYKNPDLLIQLKRIGQYYYEKSHSREEFMKHVHKNYLIEPLTDEEKQKYQIVENDEPLDITKEDLPWMKN